MVSSCKKNTALHITNTPKATPLPLSRPLPPPFHTTKCLSSGKSPRPAPSFEPCKRWSVTNRSCKAPRQLPGSSSSRTPRFWSFWDSSSGTGGLFLRSFKRSFELWEKLGGGKNLWGSTKKTQYIVQNPRKTLKFFSFQSPQKKQLAPHRTLLQVWLLREA